MRRVVFSVSLCLCGLSFFPPSVAQVRGPLGKISFPNSGAPAAQADFIRGVLWLHSFGYEEAIDAFRAAQKIDPSFAMAHWGEAMAFNQPLWFHEDVAAGQAALAKLGPTPSARAAKAKTPREQAYIAAVEALWSAGPKAARDKAYADRMAALAQQYPQDDEAQVFDALAILAMLPRGDSGDPAARARRRNCRRRVRPKPAASRRAALHPARLRSRGAGGARPARGSGVHEDRTRGKPRPAHAGARVRAARVLGRGGGQRSGLVGRLDRLGISAQALGRDARLSQPHLAAVRMDAAGPLRQGRRRDPSDRRRDGGRRERRRRGRPSLRRQRDRPRQRSGHPCATIAGRCVAATSSKASGGAR